VTDCVASGDVNIANCTNAENILADIHKACRAVYSSIFWKPFWI